MKARRILKPGPVPEADQITVVIPQLPPSGSEYSRLHFGAKKRLRECFAKWLWLILVNRFPLRGKAAPPIRIDAVIYRRYLLDVDNLHAGAKPVWDGARDAGLLRNDSPKWLDLRLSQAQVKTKAAERIEITISELKAIDPASAGQNLKEVKL